MRADRKSDPLMAAALSSRGRRNIGSDEPSGTVKTCAEPSMPSSPAPCPPRARHRRGNVISLRFLFLTPSPPSTLISRSGATRENYFVRAVFRPMIVEKCFPRLPVPGFTDIHIYSLSATVVDVRNRTRTNLTVVRCIGKPKMLRKGRKIQTFDAMFNGIP